MAASHPSSSNIGSPKEHFDGQHEADPAHGAVCREQLGTGEGRVGYGDPQQHTGSGTFTISLNHLSHVGLPSTSTGLSERCVLEVAVVGPCPRLQSPAWVSEVPQTPGPPLIGMAATHPLCLFSLFLSLFSN